MLQKTKLLITAILVLVTIVGVSQSVFAQPLPAPATQLSVLPEIVYLGQGPGTFSVDAPLSMIVKTYNSSGFFFDIHPAGTYEAKDRERVWSINTVPEGGIPAYHSQFVVFSTVTAGCVLDYVQIEDNVDDRINTFYINNVPVHTVPQGMVTYDSFVIPTTGQLEFDAVDSVGLLVLPCQNQPTLPPPPTATPSSTATSEVPTATPVGITPTVEASSTATPTTPPGITPNPSLTPPPDATITPESPTQPAPTATLPAPTVPGATDQPQQPSNTPVSTAASIPVTGGGPGPAQIGWMAVGLLAALSLLGSAWWRLLRQTRRNG